MKPKMKPASRQALGGDANAQIEGDKVALCQNPNPTSSQTRPSGLSLPFGNVLRAPLCFVRALLPASPIAISSSTSRQLFRNLRILRGELSWATSRRSSSPTLPLPAASFSNGTGFSTKLSPLEVPCSNSEERQGGAEGKPTGILYRKKVIVDLGGFLERSSMEFDTASCLWPETGLVSSGRVSGVDLPEKANDEEEKTSRKWATKCSLPQAFYFVDAS